MNTEAERRALQLKAFELKRSGKEYREIAETLNIGLGTAFNYVRRYFDELDAVAKESADDLRRLEAARLDIWLDRINGQIELGVDTDSITKLVTTGVKLMERRAKLLGLDAPTKVETKDVTETRKQLEKLSPQERIAKLQSAIEQERERMQKSQEQTH